MQAKSFLNFEEGYVAKFLYLWSNIEYASVLVDCIRSMETSVCVMDINSIVKQISFEFMEIFEKTVLLKKYVCTCVSDKT